jgi:SHS2 domain-containing protein
MSYRMIEHTADLCFEVTAGSFEELAAEALRAMTEWSGPWWGNEAARRDFFLEAQDRAILLVDLLNEALTLSQIHRESYERIEFLRVGEHMAEGRFIGRTVTGATDEIKAVTYHGASVEHLSDGAWSATILMDI